LTSRTLGSVGEKWLSISNKDGGRRLDDDNDPVRREIEAAIQYQKRIIPIVTPGVELPPKAELPESMGALVRHNRVVLDHETFEADVDRLVKTLPWWWQRRIKRLAPALACVLVIAPFLPAYLEDRTVEPPSLECEWPAAEADYEVPLTLRDPSGNPLEEAVVEYLPASGEPRRLAEENGRWMLRLGADERPPCGIAKIRARRTGEVLAGYVLLSRGGATSLNVELGPEPTEGETNAAVRGRVILRIEAGRPEEPVGDARVKLRYGSEEEFACSDDGGSYVFPARYQSESRITLEAEKGACRSIPVDQIVRSSSRDTVLQLR